jgi:hypothetical protein
MFVKSHAGENEQGLGELLGLEQTDSPDDQNTDKQVDTICNAGVEGEQEVLEEHGRGEVVSVEDVNNNNMMEDSSVAETLDGEDCNVKSASEVQNVTINSNGVEEITDNIESVVIDHSNVNVTGDSNEMNHDLTSDPSGEITVSASDSTSEHIESLSTQSSSVSASHGLFDSHETHATKKSSVISDASSLFGSSDSSTFSKDIGTLVSTKSIETPSINSSNNNSNKSKVISDASSLFGSSESTFASTMSDASSLFGSSVTNSTPDLFSPKSTCIGAPPIITRNTTHPSPAKAVTIKGDASDLFGSTSTDLFGAPPPSASAVQSHRPKNTNVVSTAADLFSAPPPSTLSNNNAKKSTAADLFSAPPPSLTSSNSNYVAPIATSAADLFSAPPTSTLSSNKGSVKSNPTSAADLFSAPPSSTVNNNKIYNGSVSPTTSSAADLFGSPPPSNNTSRVSEASSTNNASAADLFGAPPPNAFFSNHISTTHGVAAGLSGAPPIDSKLNRSTSKGNFTPSATSAADLFGAPSEDIASSNMNASSNAQFPNTSSNSNLNGMMSEVAVSEVFSAPPPTIISPKHTTHAANDVFGTAPSDVSSNIDLHEATNVNPAPAITETPPPFSYLDNNSTIAQNNESASDVFGAVSASKIPGATDGSTASDLFTAPPPNSSFTNNLPASGTDLFSAPPNASTDTNRLDRTGASDAPSSTSSSNSNISLSTAGSSAADLFGAAPPPATVHNNSQNGGPPVKKIIAKPIVTAKLNGVPDDLFSFSAAPSSELFPSDENNLFGAPPASVGLFSQPPPGSNRGNTAGDVFSRAPPQVSNTAVVDSFAPPSAPGVKISHSITSAPPSIRNTAPASTAPPSSSGASKTVSKNVQNKAPSSAMGVPPAGHILTPHGIVKVASSTDAQSSGHRDKPVDSTGYVAPSAPRASGPYRRPVGPVVSFGFGGKVCIMFPGRMNASHSNPFLQAPSLQGQR